MTAKYSAPTSAYRQFFEAFNAHDAERWAGVMSYPHVRVSPPRAADPRRPGVVRWRSSRVFDSAADYAATASWDAIEATGWVRTEGIEPVTVHESDDRVHLAGGWTRFNVRDEAIVENRVTYVMTRIEGSWGIQARFGVDSFERDADVAAEAEAAVASVERVLDAWRAGDPEACAGSCNLPLVVVGVGSVRSLDEATAILRELGPSPVAGGADRSVEAIQSGRRGVNVAVSAGAAAGAGPWRAVFLVTDHDGHWGPEAVSLIR